MMRGSTAQAPMSQPARPTRTNRNAVLALGAARRRSHAIARIAPAPAHTPSTAAITGCGQWRIALTRSPVMRVNSRSWGMVMRVSGPMMSWTSPQAQQLVLLAARKTGEHLDHPLLVRACHLGKGALAVLRQVDAEGAPVGRLIEPLDQAFLLELVDDRSDVAAGDHQQARELVHLQAVRTALELRHEIEARQRRREPLAQPRAHHALDHLRAGEEPEPDAQRPVIVGPRHGLAIGVHDSERHKGVSSKPQ